MRNHDQKAKDLAESVLPSTRRRQARTDRRAAHARHRSRQHVQLQAIRAGADEDGFDTSLEVRRSAELTELVWERRAADKTAPLVRWARVRVARDPALRRLDAQDQVAELARLMPDNLIGRHAVQHIRWGLEDSSWLAQAQARRRAQQTDWLEVMRREVAAILESGDHRALNHGVRALVRAEAALPAVPRPRFGAAPERAACRLLAGAHDVEAFAVAHHRNTAVRALVARLAGPA
ncbi:MAG: hypothetical protein ACT4PP_06565 [Sporichthyaceae bacterium]